TYPAIPRARQIGNSCRGLTIPAQNAPAGLTPVRQCSLIVPMRDKPYQPPKRQDGRPYTGSRSQGPHLPQPHSGGAFGSMPIFGMCSRCARRHIDRRPAVRSSRLSRQLRKRNMSTLRKLAGVTGDILVLAIGFVIAVPFFLIIAGPFVGN